jgi:crossover junction endodeoxyribonuclease RusA
MPLTPKKPARKKRFEFPVDGLPAGRLLADRLIIPMPIPPVVLRPNGQHGHWSVIRKAKKIAKSLALTRTLQALDGRPRPCAVAYTLSYYFAASTWDDDNAIASVKSYLDGIAKALGQDDRHFRFRELITAKDAKRPRLEIIIHLAL